MWAVLGATCHYRLALCLECSLHAWRLLRLMDAVKQLQTWRVCSYSYKLATVLGGRSSRGQSTCTPRLDLLTGALRALLLPSATQVLLLRRRCVWLAGWRTRTS